MLILALVAVIACEHHAQMIARGATKGVKAQVAQIDPAAWRAVGDQAARGAVTGALAELASEQHRELVSEIVDTTSQAAARGVAMSLDSEKLQQLVDRTVASAVGGVGRHLAADTMLQEQLGAMTHQMSASAVYGARDALFPECSSAADRRGCIEDEVGEMARAAARGMMGGLVSAARWPILALAFLAGVLVTLLIVGARTRVPEHRHHRPA
jgi:hypothetical protein